MGPLEIAIWTGLGFGVLTVIGQSIRSPQRTTVAMVEPSAFTDEERQEASTAKPVPQYDLANDNDVTDSGPLDKALPIEQVSEPVPANDAPEIVKVRDEALIEAGISALRNMGLTKTKAKAHCNAVYDGYSVDPSLNDFIRDCIKALHVT